ncbi:hypothetical protein D9Q98_008428 [Chlorella vulgaris]|uniref:Uncharacterized protein n=1 Tax=Chlorella vulgaris TaxID=3077 RepID=A0A9D4YTJ6_CHLVU|nr:hypothetical protein D9Q98_008428 [Chlorella vulgaris]
MGSCCSAPNTVSDYDHPTYKPSQWPAGADSRPMPGPYHTAPAMHQASYAVPGYPAQGQNGYGQQQYPGMASAHSYPGNPGAYNQAPGGYPGYPPQVGAMPPQGNRYQQQQYMQQGQYGRPGMGGMGFGGGAMMGGGMGLLGGMMLGSAFSGGDCGDCGDGGGDDGGGGGE